MWCLGRFLPLMIGVFVPEDDPHWLHFLTLLDIMDYIFSPIVRPGQPAHCQVRQQFSERVVLIN